VLKAAKPMRNSLRRLGLACCLLAALPLCALATAAHRANDSEAAWERAVALRMKLEATPPEQRTKERFEETLDAYRLVYHQSPDSGKAPAAVAAVAELLAEKGRVLGDPKALRSAIGQYEFLRQQYPKSPQVDNALLLEGEICRQDLKDAACAEEQFRAVIESEPNTSYAEEAAMELKQLQAAQLPAPKVAAQTSQTAKRRRSDSAAATENSEVHTEAAQPVAFAPIPPPEALVRAARGGRRVTITGMRHWSNPTSTRIAIDLGGKVEYEAARVPNPDRIFFDLHGARLAPGLNGHQVEVVDDGFLKRIRAAQFQPDITRVVLDVTDVTEFSAFLLPNPWRLIIDIHSDKAPAKGATLNARPPQPAPSAPDNVISDVAKLSSEPAEVRATAGPTSEPVSAQVTHPAPDAVADASQVPAVKSRKKGKANSVADSDSDVASALPHAADPASDGQRSLVRALGLKVGRIVIDAGHGGHDSGTLGPGGIEEKDVVLDVALRTGRLLHQRLGAEIVYTRDDDTFIPLETRTAIANKAQADLFLSIHGNSSPEPSARGVEVYYLNFTSDPNALEVAARENAVSSHSVHQLSDLVRKITLKDKIDESREFAADVDSGLYAGLRSGNSGLKNRGVKKAPFVVLIGAQMPSILAEISFLTNPADAQLMREGSYRERIAESLDAGVERYLRGLSGMRPAVKAVVSGQ
jgi:N-acetylmuramoyl-L-alanine amidase